MRISIIDGLENCQTIGRNGLHPYNNQDHAMLTGMLAGRDLVLGQRNDLWSINTDQEYHEEIRGQVTEHDLEEVIEGALTQVFLKLDRVAMGLSVGVASGALRFLATLALVLKGGPVVGPTPGAARAVLPRLHRHGVRERAGSRPRLRERVRRPMGVRVPQERDRVPLHGGRAPAGRAAGNCAGSSNTSS